MNPLDQLIAHFEQFPGVGGRQAKRFAFHVLRLPPDEASKLGNLIEHARTTVVECASCHRYFSKRQAEDMCSICTAPNRERKRLLVVERDSDVQAIERAGVYDGLYFVLGGTVPLLSAPENSQLRSGALRATVATRIPQGLSEVILGFSINPDGENTARFVASFLSESVELGLKLSYLGRGLSTGSELEYADSETIKNAWQNRA